MRDARANADNPKDHHPQQGVNKKAQSGSHHHKPKTL